MDLEIGARTRAQLAPLIEALPRGVHEIFRGRIRGVYRVDYEIYRPRAGANAVIRDLAGVIERLPRAARRAWDAAVRREFNVGVELAPDASSVELAIDAAVVQRVAALGGRIAFTAYAAARRRSARAGRIG